MAAGATQRSGNGLGLLLRRGDHGVNVFCRPGLAEKVSLSLGAARPLQIVEFLLRLDSFRGRFDSEADGQLRNGADDGPAILFAGKVVDEAAIDLDLVEGEGPQIAQGRVAGAEIVHRDTHAESPQMP